MADVTELYGSGIEFVTNSEDLPRFPEVTELKGFGVEFVQQGSDISVPDTTTIMGFSLEFVDYPRFAFQIMTRNL